MRLVLYLLIGAFVLTACNDHHEPRADAGPIEVRFQRYLKRCREHVPQASEGRKPAGTREDPFVGHGVVFATKELSPELVRVGIRHRAIPYFKIASEMAVNLPRHVVKGIREGHFVRLRFARLYEDDAAFAKAFESASTSTGPVAYVHCGYELFALDVVPDSEFPQ